jgi:7-cyano-7-deazaguanine synthase
MSGGLDSGVLLYRLITRGVRLTPLYLRCGLRWEPAELYWLRRFLRSVRSPLISPLLVVELPLRSLYGSHWSLGGSGVPGPRSADAAVYLPGRNVLLLSAAAIVCTRHRLGAIIVGLLRGNPFGDASRRFLRRMAASLSLALQRPIRILAPLRAMSKTRLIRSASGCPLHLTFSCLRPRGRLHCGRCNKCAERRRAFRVARVSDPTTYVR